MDINLVPGLYESLNAPYLVRPTQDGLRLYAAMRRESSASTIRALSTISYRKIA